jgi:hypothetical protein
MLLIFSVALHVDKNIVKTIYLSLKKLKHHIDFLKLVWDILKQMIVFKRVKLVNYFIRYPQIIGTMAMS